MTKEELAVNIVILEALGWFIAEAEDNEEFDVVLLCCDKEGHVWERVPVTDFLLAFYDEEDGGLIERLWFFAPHFSTDVSKIEHLLSEWPAAFEWRLSRYFFMDKWFYEAEVTQLVWSDEGDCCEYGRGRAWEQDSAAMALSIAYIKCKDLVYESDPSV